MEGRQLRGCCSRSRWKPLTKACDCSPASGALRPPNRLHSGNSRPIFRSWRQPIGGPNICALSLPRYCAGSTPPPPRIDPAALTGGGDSPNGRGLRKHRRHFGSLAGGWRSLNGGSRGLLVGVSPGTRAFLAPQLCGPLAGSTGKSVLQPQFGSARRGRVVRQRSRSPAGSELSSILPSTSLFGIGTAMDGCASSGSSSAMRPRNMAFCGSNTPKRVGLDRFRNPSSRRRFSPNHGRKQSSAMTCGRCGCRIA